MASDFAATLLTTAPQIGTRPRAPVKPAAPTSAAGAFPTAGPVAAKGIAGTGGPAAAPNDRITRAAQEFESQFLGQMFQQIWSTVEVDPTFGGGSGEEMFRGMMVTEFGKIMASRGGTGLSEQVRRQLLLAQEQRP